jgi:hypothetical protein
MANIFSQNWQRRIENAVRAVEDAPPLPAAETWFVEITSTTQTDGRYPGNGRRYSATAKTWADEEDCWVVDANGAALVTGRQYLARLWQSGIGSPAKPVLITDRDSGDAQSVTTATISTGQNDYAVPTDVLAVNPSSSFAFTGFEAPDSGSRVIEIINTGSNTISFTSESASSTAANRIYNPNGYTLPARTSGYLIYDTVNARWNLAFSGVSGSGGAGDLADFQFIAKASDESVTSSTTLQDDNELTFAIGANETWFVQCWLLIDADLAGDLTCALTAPAGATGWWGGHRFASGASDAVNEAANWSIQTNLTTASSRDIGGAGAGTVVATPCQGYVVNSSTAGSVTLSWAQRASSATATTLKAGSCMIAYKIGTGSTSGIVNGASGQFWRMNEAGSSQVWRGAANDFLVDTTITAAENGESWRHTSATPHAVTLPAVADCGNQWYAYFYNDNSGTVTVSVPSGSFLHGTASFTLEQDECALVHTTGGGGFGVYRSWALTVPATRFGLLNALTDATPAAADRFPFYDDSAAANRDCSGTGLAEMVETILGLREVLTAARTYYVRTDGSDSNTGLADTAGGAFLTIQKAVDTVAALDISIYDVTIQVRSGTFTGAIAIDGPWIGSGDVALVGDTTTPGNVIISVAGNCITVEAYAHVSVRGFKLTSSAGDQGLIYCKDNATVNIDGKMEFGAANTFHLYCFTGGNINITADYTINGNAVGGFAADRGASINFSGTITATMSGTPAFSGAAHMRVAGTSVIEGLAGVTFSGAATGTRYDAQTNGVINTAGGGANYIPGNAAGSTATGGQYV